MNSFTNDVPILIGQVGPLNGNRWQVADVMVIGREKSCEIVIPDRQVSRFHARLSQAEDGVVIEDLASKNGTFRNGIPVIEPQYLQDGDAFQIATVQNFVFLSSDATLPIEQSTANVSRSGRLYLDERSRRVWIGKKEVLPPFSAQQFRLLQTLYEQQGKVVSRQEGVMAAWGENHSQGVTEQALDALVRRLRDRLHDADPSHNYLITVRGHGLRLDNPVD